MENTSAWLKKYDLPVPRYTSYPAAPHFTFDFGSEAFATALAGIETQAPLSLYIHFPFCRSLCWYCGCNMKVANDSGAMMPYATAVRREIEMVAALIPGRKKVDSIHFGGGTPTWGPRAGREAVTQALRAQFDLAPDTDFSVEADPRTLDGEIADELAALGVNRVSIGVQDFDAPVQEAINRIQPFSVVERGVMALRRAGLRDLNIDLIYGLPLQTPETVARTIELAISLTPQRIALFGYAHVPWMKKHQKLVERLPLPDAAQRLALFSAAQKTLTEHGFVQIGIDHFAAPDDKMARAAANGTLNRNFQGYTTDTSPTLLGFGASAISALPMSYAQNDPGIESYIDTIASGRLATVRGRHLTAEDARRREIIMNLMCNARCTISPDIAVQAAPALAPLVEDGLCRWENRNDLVMTDEGKPWVRVVAACFDSYHAPSTARHARAV
ncbi:MAG: oxygen-independent coproporphyrinogen III oxidase [Proteobacteria bacterium]|nr:oxygen-independent coproporphyrinogen III oxidase [Pseudomonadota bacterium]